MRRDPEYTGAIHHPDCEQGKLGYTSKQELRRVLKRSAHKFGKSHINIYRCPTCDLYHNSSMRRVEYQEIWG